MSSSGAIRAYDRILKGIAERPGRVIGVALAVTLLAAISGAGVEFRSSRAELAGTDDPEQERLELFFDDYPNSGDLLICVEPESGNTATGIGAFTDRLAAELRRSPSFAGVFHGIDPGWLEEHAAHLVPAAMAREMAAGLPLHADGLQRAAAEGTLGGINRALAGVLREGLEEMRPSRPEDAARGLSALLSFLAWQESLAGTPGRTVARLDPVAAARLGTRDGSLLVLQASPTSRDDSIPALRRLLDEVRAAAREISAEQPGFRVRFSGQPAIAVDEMRQVRRDTFLSAGVAAVGVGLLVLSAFRWPSHALLVLAALAAGVIWSLGMVRLETGYLNLITSSFVSTLMGVGVAYGIHPVSEYEMQGAHREDPAAALRRAFGATAGAVTVSALTTAAAFFAIMLMDFRGFAELGLVAGAGVILCLAAALLLLPALLSLRGRRPDRHRRISLLDRLAPERLAALACRAPRSVALLGTALTLAFGAAAWDTRFDSDIRSMMPAEADSMRLQRRLMEESELSPDVVFASAPDPEALGDLHRRAAGEPTIERVESALLFLDAGDRGKAADLSALSELFARLRLPERPARLTAEDWGGSLVELAAALGDASEAAFTAGLGELAGTLEEARARAADLAALIRDAAPEKRAAWQEAHVRLDGLFRQARASFLASARTPPPQLQDLPADLRARLITRSGRYVAILHPAGDIFDAAFRSELFAASRRVDPGSTGFPLVFHHITTRVTSGFLPAVATGAALVLFILLLKTRSLTDTLLAILPLAMGMVWMLGSMRLLGLSFNFANLVAVPLIIGVGIDNGVHVVHRLRREGSAGLTTVLRHTCRAILIASTTTMIGFGTLALASHHGLASLGMALLLGVTSCLITSTLFLPALLIAFRAAAVDTAGDTGAQGG